MCSSPPSVTVCLPNLNNRKFLNERLDTILNQTYKDWELVVVDGYSDDGAWELIQEYAAGEPRMRICQAPREGIYEAINACLRLARGKYVYIATSDDTMVPGCLHQMVAALNAHPECGLAHCRLQVLDLAGNVVTAPSLENSPVSQYLNGLSDVSHIRYAPHDGLLHVMGYTVYTSLTQLLIRHSLIEKIGLFRSSWGSIGDFEWGMRAGLVTNTIYIPEALASWRVHEHQATASVDFYSEHHLMTVLAMMREAIKKAREIGDPSLGNLSQRHLETLMERRLLLSKLGSQKGPSKKLIALWKYLWRRPDVFWAFVGYRLLGLGKGRMKPHEWAKSELARYLPQPWHRIVE